ncbi:hypothetical protein ANO14919_120610 [Xylariales sp. No.14919]|nr:hypothetical protein ANO14919_120610 [Xylariales sp. No.14919]
MSIIPPTLEDELIDALQGLQIDPENAIRNRPMPRDQLLSYLFNRGMRLTADPSVSTESVEMADDIPGPAKRERGRRSSDSLPRIKRARLTTDDSPVPGSRVAPDPVAKADISTQTDFPAPPPRSRSLPPWRRQVLCPERQTTNAVPRESLEPADFAGLYLRDAYEVFWHWERTGLLDYGVASPQRRRAPRDLEALLALASKYNLQGPTSRSKAAKTLN